MNVPPGLSPSGNEPPHVGLPDLLIHFLTGYKSVPPGRRWSFVLRVVKILFWKRFFAYSILFGAGIGVMVAIGQSYAVGFHAARKLYGLWWILSPLFFPVILVWGVVQLTLMEGIPRIVKRLKPPFPKLIGWLAAILFFAGGSLFLGYVGGHQDNPMLSSEPPNLDTLSRSVGDQRRILGNLSESGQALLGQLDATEIELKNAKKQLAATLTNFDAQQHEAGQVTEELKRIDDRQKQIALQAEELQRILEGQQPITRRDLQQANLKSSVYGFILGFLASLLASWVWAAFVRTKPVTS